jgi:hypothetical protein
VSPARVVEALDEVEDGHLGLRLGPESAAVQELALEGGEEALAQRISYASPTEPIEGRTPASRHLRPKAMDVYWHP